MSAEIIQMHASVINTCIKQTRHNSQLTSVGRITITLA